MNAHMMQVVCARCGLVNEKTFQLTADKTVSVYHCDICDNVIISTWIGTERNLE